MTDSIAAAQARAKFALKISKQGFTKGKGRAVYSSAQVNHVIPRESIIQAAGGIASIANTREARFLAFLQKENLYNINSITYNGLVLNAQGGDYTALHLGSHPEYTAASNAKIAALIEEPEYSSIKLFLDDPLAWDAYWARGELPSSLRFSNEGITVTVH